jgi:hypothetical protein
VSATRYWPGGLDVSKPAQNKRWEADDATRTYREWDEAGALAVERPYTAAEDAAAALEAVAQAAGVNTAARRQKLAGAKARARQVVTLSQAAGARGSAAWTQAQRVAVLDAVGDLAKMLAWLADDLLDSADPPE